MAAGASGLTTSQIKKLKEDVWGEQISYLSDELGDPSRYFPYLMSKDVLNQSDCQIIKAQVTNSEKVVKFVGMIKKRESKKQDPSLDVFVDALKKQKVQAHIARALQRAYAKKKEELEIKLGDYHDEAQFSDVDGTSNGSDSTVTTPNGGLPSSGPPSGSDPSTPHAESYDMHAGNGPLPNAPPKIPPGLPTVNGNSHVHSKYGPCPPSPPPTNQTTNMYPYKAQTPHDADKSQMALSMPKHMVVATADPTSELGGRFQKVLLEDEEQGGQGQQTGQTSLLSSLSNQFTSFPSEMASVISSQLISGRISLDVSGPLSDVSTDSELVEKLIEEIVQLKHHIADCNMKLSVSEMQIVEYQRQNEELKLALKNYDSVCMELQHEKAKFAGLLQSSAQGLQQQHLSKLAEDNETEIEQLKMKVFLLDREKNELKIQADEFQLQRDAVLRDVNVLQMSLRPQYLPVSPRQTFVVGAPPHPPTGFQQPQIVDQQQFIPPTGGAHPMVYQGEPPRYVHKHSVPGRSNSVGGGDTQHLHQHHNPPNTLQYHAVPSPGFGISPFSVDGGGGGGQPPFGQSPSSLRSSNTSISSFGGSGMRQI